jgi:FkbM family methyltransferase
MSKRSMEKIALAGYGLAVRTGLMSTPLARRLFVFAYRQYKQRVEARSINHLRRFVEPASTAIDVGANVGFFTTRFMDWVGEGGTVIAIEPDQENLAALRRAVASSGLRRQVEIVAAVAAEHRGILKLERNELHPGDHKIAIGDNGIDVEAVTLDDIAARRGNRISFIKIDVQGAEVAVLRGARRILREDAPTLFVEVHDQSLARYGQSADTLATLIEAEGYAINHLDDNGTITPIDRASLHAALDDRIYIDVLCLRSKGHESQ